MRARPLRLADARGGGSRGAGCRGWAGRCALQADVRAGQAAPSLAGRLWRALLLLAAAMARPRWPWLADCGWGWLGLARRWLWLAMAGQG